MLVCKYVDHNGSAAILAVKRSASTAPEVNLKIPLNVGNEGHNQGVLPLKPKEDVARSPKQGHQCPHKKGLTSLKKTLWKHCSTVENLTDVG